MAHENKMEILTRNDQRFSVVIGKAAPDIVLPAMPIRILYTGVERDYLSEMVNGECFFKMRVPESFTPGWNFDHSWDAYKLREAFEKLASPEDAWLWLNVIGTFRYKRGRSKQDVLAWREIQGWQEVLRRLRLRDSSEWFPLLGVQGRNSKSTFHRSEFIAELGVFSKEIWTVSEETFGWLQGFPQGLSICRDRYISREATEAIFSSPGTRVPDSHKWHHAQSVLARRRAERARGDSEGKQKLIAEVTPATALDAILATIYVDKLRGIEFQVCALKECNETFERQSDHGKMYCSNYHAHLASVRRKRSASKEVKAGQLHRKEKTR
jgi:hypothetical protein